MFRNLRFMAGRNGMDALGRLTWIACIALFVATAISHNFIVYLCAAALLLCSVFRMFSRNLDRRYLENQRFLKILDHTRYFFRDFGWKSRSFFTETGRKIRYGTNRRQQAKKERAKEREVKKAQREQLRQEKKIYRYFSCPQCGQSVRIPRGHGKVEITCPKCSAVFQKRT